MHFRLTIACCALLLSACNQEQGDLSASSASKIEVRDYRGNIVRLEQPASRIVALAPHVVENVFSAGAGDKLVGVMAYSDFPAAAKALPLIGGYEKINYERILELEPDLIIAWDSGNHHSSVSRLAELGFTVYIDQPDTLMDVARSIRDIGVLTGNAEAANRVADDYLKHLNTVIARYQSVDRVSVLYQVWNKPLQTINGNHIISAAIEACGGVNIYADEFAVAPVINIESVLERNPTAIIASGVSSSRPAWLDEWKQWSSLTAVQNDNLFFVDPNHIQRHTVRLLLGIRAICEQLDQARKR